MRLSQESCISVSWSKWFFFHQRNKVLMRSASKKTSFQRWEWRCVCIGEKLREHLWTKQCGRIGPDKMKRVIDATATKRTIRTVEWREEEELRRKHSFFSFVVVHCVTDSMHYLHTHTYIHEIMLWEREREREDERRTARWKPGAKIRQIK